jgi:hypothetical protein
MIALWILMLWTAIGFVWFLIGFARVVIYHEPRTIWFHRLLPPLFLALGLCIPSLLHIWPLDGMLQFLFVLTWLIIAFVIHRATMRENWKL